MTAFKIWALTALFRWFGRMSPAGRQRTGKALTWVALRLAGRRTGIVRRNLQLCFPDQPESVREQWMRDHFRALCQSIVDRGLLWYGDPAAIRDTISLEGDEQIAALLAQGRPVILLAPHFTSLDAAATRLSMVIPSSATMYTPQRDPAVDAIVHAGRARFNDVRLVNRKDGVRDLIRYLRELRAVYYLPDMDFGSTGSVFVPFFGVPAATLLATAQLARKWNAAVLPIVDYWNPATGKYRVQVLPPLAGFPGDDSLEDATARLNREIESWVLECPSQYYWVHRRFKTRPDGEPKLY